jgi:hypothetical protein
VVVGASSIAGSTTTVMVSAGTPWKYCELTNVIVTDGSRAHSKTIVLRLIQK